MKKKATVLLSALAVLVIFLIIFHSSFENMGIRHGAKVFGNRIQSGLLTDGRMHILLVGAGSPIPDPNRAQSCTAVIAGGDFLLFDTGAGAASRRFVFHHPTFLVFISELVSLRLLSA